MIDIADAVSQVGHPIDKFKCCDSHYNITGQALPSATTEILKEGEDRLLKSFHILSQRIKDFSIYIIPVSNKIFFPQALPAGLAEPQ